MTVTSYFGFAKGSIANGRERSCLGGANDRIYSIKTVDELGRKFSEVGVPMAGMTPPDARMKIYVNANNVKNVDQGDPAVFHEKARSVLVFSKKVRVAYWKRLDKWLRRGWCDLGDVRFLA